MRGGGSGGAVGLIDSCAFCDSASLSFVNLRPPERGAVASSRIEELPLAGAIPNLSGASSSMLIGEPSKIHRLKFLFTSERIMSELFELLLFAPCSPKMGSRMSSRRDTTFGACPGRARNLSLMPGATASKLALDPT